MTYWLFQGNPKYYHIIDGIREFEQMPWFATRYAKDMVAGDGVLIWKSGERESMQLQRLLNLPKLL
jgi:hypothetical protein